MARMEPTEETSLGHVDAVEARVSIPTTTDASHQAAITNVHVASVEERASGRKRGHHSCGSGLILPQVRYNEDLPRD